jgi:hypothetical protein
LPFALAASTATARATATVPAPGRPTHPRALRALPLRLENGVEIAGVRVADVRDL